MFINYLVGHSCWVSFWKWIFALVKTFQWTALIREIRTHQQPSLLDHLNNTEQATWVKKTCTQPFMNTSNRIWYNRNVTIIMDVKLLELFTRWPWKKLEREYSFPFAILYLTDFIFSQLTKVLWFLYWHESSDSDKCLL